MWSGSGLKHKTNHAAVIRVFNLPDLAALTDFSPFPMTNKKKTHFNPLQLEMIIYLGGLVRH